MEFTQLTRDAARRRLLRTSKTVLASTCREGVTGPDGVRLAVDGFQMDRWTKNELASAILGITHPLTAATS